MYRPFQFHERSQYFIAAHNETLFRHDAVIRVYDDAGNVIERTSTRAVLKDWESGRANSSGFLTNSA